MPQRKNQINISLSKTEMEQLDRLRECRNPPCSRYALGKEAVLGLIKKELSEIERRNDNPEGSTGPNQVTRKGFYGDLAEIFKDRKEARKLGHEIFRPK